MRRGSRDCGRLSTRRKPPVVMMMRTDLRRDYPAAVIEHDALPEPGPHTYVLLFTVTSESAEAVQLAVGHLRDQVIPAASVAPGSKGALALAGSSGRSALALTFWDSMETMLDVGRSDQQALQEIPGLEVWIERYEIVADERPD